MRKILFFIFLLYFGNILYSQPIRFFRMYLNSNIGISNRFYNVIPLKNEYIAFGISSVNTLLHIVYNT